jgi:sugar/nucleoside kinase (ribokinase family)
MTPIADSFLKLDQEGAAEQVVVRSGGAPGNVGSILSILGVPSLLYGLLGRDESGERYRRLFAESNFAATGVIRGDNPTGVAVTWYTPYRPGESVVLVAPPESPPEHLWTTIGETLEVGDLLYLDGYMLSALDAPIISLLLRNVGDSSFRVVWDLAQAGQVAAFSDRLVQIAGTIIESGVSLILLASPQELEPLGGVKGLFDELASKRGPGGSGSVRELFLKESPAGCCVYDFGGSKPEVVTRYRGPVVEILEDTGIGDAFAAGLISAIWGGAGRSEKHTAAACAVAHSAATLCAKEVGGFIRNTTQVAHERR